LAFELVLLPAAGALELARARALEPLPRPALRLHLRHKNSFIGSPRTAGPQPRDVLRLARPRLSARLGRRGPSPAMSCGSPDLVYRLASARGAPAPPRPAAPPTTRYGPSGPGSGAASRPRAPDC